MVKVGRARCICVVGVLIFLIAPLRIEWEVVVAAALHCGILHILIHLRLLVFVLLLVDLVLDHHIFLRVVHNFFLSQILFDLLIDGLVFTD